MKVSGGLSEEGVVIGNTFDKYNSKNPVVRKIMRGFKSNLTDLVNSAEPSSIHEVGCGEGYWTLQWAVQFEVVNGSDFSSTVIKIAKENAVSRHLSENIFKKKSIYDLVPNEDRADLIVCCEVLEHLEEPEEALSVLKKLAPKAVILSVPREPVWSVLNMVRGKYWGHFGNTPGHIQRWSQKEFVHLASRFFKVVEVRAPLPWTMLLCRPYETNG